MGVMPGNVSKGPLLKKFDEFINTPKKAMQPTSNLDDALLAYQDPNATPSSIVQFGVLKGILPAQQPVGGAYNHIIDDWLPEAKFANSDPEKDPDPEQPKSWWPKFFPLGEVLCQGLCNALRLCLYENPDEADPAKLTRRPSPLPIDTYWVCAGNHFEVATLLGHDWSTGNKKPHHVTMLILTPTAPGSDRSGTYSEDKLEDIWISRHDEVEPYMKGVRTTDRGIETVRPRDAKLPNENP